MFDSIRTIPVRVRPPYDVRIGSGLLGRCGDYLAALLGQRRIAVLADDTVASLYLDTVTSGASGMSSCPPPCWRRWTPPWGVRPPWT